MSCMHSEPDRLSHLRKTKQSPREGSFWPRLLSTLSLGALVSLTDGYGYEYMPDTSLQWDAFAAAWLR